MPDLGWWPGLLALLVIAGSIVLLPILLLGMPADHFAREAEVPAGQARHPVVRGLRNLAGLVLLAVGVVMLVTPGQGVLTILAGLFLLDLPGKRALERRLVGRAPVLRAVNRLRVRAGRPPLVAPPSSLIRRDAR